MAKKKLNKKAMQFLVQKYYEKWAKDNPILVKAMDEYAADAAFFHMKWGSFPPFKAPPTSI